MNIIDHPSPNHGPRNDGKAARYVVIHYTGMKRDALARMCDPAAEVSAHYMIREDGTILRLVDEERRAWHAGKSFWRGERDMNSASIGIELEHPGHDHGYREFAPAQIAALAELVADIQARRKIPAENVLAHSDIAPERKIDPGELFPWEKLAARGIGVWPKAALIDWRPVGPHTAQKLLREIGFDVPDSGVYDAPTKAALSAFQRHWRPAKFDGEMDRETGVRLRALARELRNRAKAPKNGARQTAGRPPGPA